MVGLLAACPFGTKIYEPRTDNGTYTLTRPLPFLSSCAKEESPARLCHTVPSKTKTQPAAVTSTTKARILYQASATLSSQRAKEDAPLRGCGQCAPSGAKTCEKGFDNGTYTFTRLLPFPPPCAKEDGPARPCDTVPAGMKTQIVGLERRMTKGTSPIATRERRPLHALSCTEEESSGSLC